MNATSRVVVRAQGVAARIPISADNRRVIAAAALVGILTLAVKVTTLLREILVAAKLGTGRETEAYIAAWAIPGFLTMIVGDAIVGSLLPMHAHARAEHGEQAADRVFAETLFVGAGLLLALTATLALLPGLVLAIFAPHFDPGKLALAHRLWLIMLPAVFINGFAAILAGRLNAGSRFGLAAAAPIAVPIATGLGLVFAPGQAVVALAAGFVVGNFIQLCLLGWELRRHAVRWLPRWHGGLPETRALFRQFFPLLANGVVFGGLPLVDVAMAATLGNRQLAILTYGNKLVLPILAISSMALATAIFPYFSRLVAEQDWTRLHHTLSTYTRLILATTIPLTVILVLLSAPIVRILYQHGKFTADDTEAVSQVQSTLALMIPCYALGVMYSRVLVSLRKSQLMLMSSILVFVVNVVGDYVFKQVIGIQGIALATVVNYAVQFTLMFWFCRRLLRERLTGDNGIKARLSELSVP
jgi:putative peptidoglycan lipid II flippase